MKRILPIIVIVLIALSVGRLTGHRVLGADTITRGGVINSINQVRGSKGLVRLNENAQLDNSAQAKAQYLCAHNIWGHGDWTAFINASGYPYQNAGENLAEGFNDLPSLVTGWLNSPEHYTNIVAPEWRDTGVGVLTCHKYQGLTNSVIIVQHFGQPKQIIKVTNKTNTTKTVCGVGNATR